MKWLENNPVGMVLLGVCGVLVLTALVLTLAWSGPGSVDVDDAEAGLETTGGVPTASLVLGDRDEYQVINERPLFNETRRPEAIEMVEEESGEEAEEVVEVVVANRPDVRLTGVVITPDARYVTLTPNKGDTEPVLASEGTPLEAAYVGWKVESIGARQVNLESARGERFNLELSVYDALIEAPPEPEARPVPGLEGEAGEEGGEPGEDGERLSRAEEIRQRIAERREQLRLEAEEEAERNVDQRAANRSQYQEAMRAMISRGANNEDSNQSDENE